MLVKASVGILVEKPHTNLKYALDTFKKHEKTIYHLSAFQTAENFVSILDKKKDSIIVQLNTKRAKRHNKKPGKIETNYPNNQIMWKTTNSLKST